MPNPFCWYRARRHARELEEFSANLVSYGITDAQLALIAERCREVFALLPTAEEMSRNMARLQQELTDA
jgi:hypothetical protein